MGVAQEVLLAVDALGLGSEEMEVDTRQLAQVAEEVMATLTEEAHSR